MTNIQSKRAKTATALTIALALVSGIAFADGETDCGPCATVRGVVRLATGQATEEHQVRLIRFADSKSFLSDPVASNGTYLLENVPEGRFAVQVRWLRSGRVYLWAPNVKVAAGDEITHDIKVSHSFPEPYPGAARWKAWKTKHESPPH